MGTNEIRVVLELHTKIDDGGKVEESTTRQTGFLYQRENMDVLMYDEELEDRSIVKNLLTMQVEQVSVKRTGPISMHQQFDVNRITENVYQHPHGNLHMGTKTNSINYRPLTVNSSGLLQMDYTVKLNGEDEQNHTLTLLLTEEALG